VLTLPGPCRARDPDRAPDPCWYRSDWCTWPTGSGSTGCGPIP